MARGRHIIANEQKRFGIAYLIGYVMPDDIAYILQRAYAAIHISQHCDHQKARQGSLAWRAAMISSLVPEHPKTKLMQQLCPLIT